MTYEKTQIEEAANTVDGGTVLPPKADPNTIATDVTPARDDESPAVVGDARVDDGTVRTNSAVEPVADVLVAGAGATVPPPENIDRDGREAFPDGVAPTARADYDGPGAPPEQRDGSAAQADKPKAKTAKSETAE